VANATIMGANAIVMMRVDSSETGQALMPTGERFRDPTSGELIEVWEDPVRGEREYRPVTES